MIRMLEERKCDRCEKRRQEVESKTTVYTAPPPFAGWFTVRKNPTDNAYTSKGKKWDFCSRKCLVEFFTVMEKPKAPDTAKVVTPPQVPMGID